MFGVQEYIKQLIEKPIYGPPRWINITSGNHITVDETKHSPVFIIINSIYVMTDGTGLPFYIQDNFGTKILSSLTPNFDPVTIAFNIYHLMQTPILNITGVNTLGFTLQYQYIQRG